MASLAIQSPQSTILENVSTDIVFKNPRPHVKSLHAYFPSVVVLPDHQMLATYVLGEAFESVDHRVHLSRSLDCGETWEPEGPLCSRTTGRLASDTCRIALMPDGELIANLIRADRTNHPNEGLANPETMGFAPTELLLARSTNLGHTWSEPVAIKTPLIGPEFEMCAPLSELRDGRWIWPTATWRDWHGNLPNGERMVALVSDDQGRSWPEYLDVMSDYKRNLIFWESKIIELFDGRLLAVAWCYDQMNQCDLPNHYALSSDSGTTWTLPLSTGLAGQTLTPLLLDDGRILSIYRRMDKQGLWANLSHLDGDRWINDGCELLWDRPTREGNSKYGDDMVENFHSLKFGAPDAKMFPNGQVFVVFWCYEEGISIIRWLKFSVT